MRPYEAMVVLRPAMEEAALEAILNRLTSVITDQGGEITHVDQWGKRRLAYVIDDHNEGFYVVIKFQGGPGITTELERIMRISDAVMRFLVVRDETSGPVPAPTTAEDEAAEAAVEAVGQAAEADKSDGAEAGADDVEAAEAVDAAGAEDIVQADADAAAETVDAEVDDDESETTQA